MTDTNTHKNYVHVVPHENGWAVKREGAERASSVHETQKEAIERGRELAKKDEGELFIHAKDGKFRDRRSYGNDPASSPG
jgi:uncharacterized protein YdaT